MRGSGLGLLGFGALCAVALSMNAGGCQADSNSTGSAGPGGPGGSGGTGGGTTSSAEGGNGGGSTTTGTAGGGGSGGSALPEATIQDITSGAIGEGVDVQVNGVVAMSRKWRVSKSNTTGSCLWGVFLSAPGLAETTAHSGILAVSYGTMGVTQPDGSIECPKLEDGPVGDAFPDDVKPGDVLDVTGETSYFLLSSCASQPADVNPSQVKQRQLAKVNKVVRTGTAPVPTPHVLTSTELMNLSSPSDQEFHDQWGGVWLRVQGPISPILQQGSVVGAYGIIRLNDGNMAPLNLQVGDKVYYVSGSQNPAHTGPIFTDPNVVWNRIDGFSTVDFCTWDLQPTDKCLDFDPPSEDCAG